MYLIKKDEEYQLVPNLNGYEDWTLIEEKVSPIEGFVKLVNNKLTEDTDRNDEHKENETVLNMPKKELLDRIKDLELAVSKLQQDNRSRE